MEKENFNFNDVLDMEDKDDDDYEIIKQEHNQDKGEGDDCEVEKGKSLKLVFKTSYEAKLRELLRNLYSFEFKMHSEASKEFIKLLRSESGGDLLNQYVRASPSCSELLEAWKLRQGKPGVAHVLSLISVILGHPDGIYKSNDFGRLNLSRNLDKLAHTIIKIKLEDIYTEINSREPRRQSASLLVMAAVVRRGVGLASEVANKFDFKLPLFPKLAESQHKSGERRTKFSTRHAFIEFAMSFLEIGNPRLLRWVLQHKDMYFGVLRGLGSDDDDTILYVLSTLRDKVLTPDSLVPPSLRSVLFGSVTLDQLISISGNSGEVSAKIAHEVLLMVCTDPSNGLMPDFKVYTNALKGNPQRILDLLKKLRAAEIGYHKDLLLNIVQGRPLFGSAYMDEFPYLLEPRSSSTWFSAISLAADLVSSTRMKITSDNRPSLDSSEVQCLLKCIVPHAFSRIAINRGLLHIHVGVRHGSMRLLLEALKSLDSLVTAIDCMSRSNTSVEKWKALKQKVQDGARALLPDCQTLINLLKSVNQNDNKCRDLSLKRPRNSEDLNEIHSSDGVKKLKSDLVDRDCDIIISGIVPEADNDVSKKRGNAARTFISEELEKEEDCVKVIAEIWGLHNSNVIGNDLRDAEKYFHSKLLDTLTLYLRTMPMVLEQSFPFLTILPSNPFTLSISQQQSLLSLLLEYIGWSPQSTISSVRPPSLMFKQLHPLLDLLTQSPVKGIQDKAHMLAQAAMLSTGLFDKNRLEMDAWLLFLPGYKRDKSSMGNHPVVVFQDWSKVVVSFLCDAVSTTGNNLYKYMDQLRCLISNSKYFTDVSPKFSPLFICTLNKCLRLLDSDSGKFKLYEKSMISMYVCNTLCFILQTQVDGRLLASLISNILTERLGDSSVCEDVVVSCEWRPLKNLLHFSRSISLQRDESGDSLCESLQNSLLLSRSVPYPKDGSSTFEKNRSSASCDSFSKVFCASPDEILENLPTVLSVSAHLTKTDLSFLSSIFFHEGSLLVKVANLWPDILHSGLELVEIAGSTSYRNDDALLEIRNQSSSSKESISSRDMKSKDSASVAFSSFLKQASFHLLYPAIMGVSNSDLLCSTKLLDLLKAKLSEGFIADSVASLRLLLFWAHQIQSSFRVAPSSEHEQLSKISSVLIKHLSEQLFLVQSDGSNLQTFESATVATYIQEIAETIFHHPIVSMSLPNPLCCNKDVRKGSLAESLIDSLDSSNGSVHPISNDIVQLLTTVADHLLGLGNKQNYVFEAEETFDRGLVKAFKTLIQWVVLMFKKKFKKPIDRKRLINLLPNFQVFYGLVRIIPPFMLLELVDYIFERSDSICSESVKLAAFSVGCYIADGAFNMLSSYVDQLNRGIGRLSQIWEVDAKSFDLTLIEKIYHRFLSLATHSKLECADVCLLKVVNIVYKQKCLPSQTALSSLCMEISRVVMRSPINLVSHCIQETTATKAKLLFLLTEVSPLHMTLFGQMFLCTRNKDLPLRENVDDLQVSGSSIIYQCLDENGLKSAHQACANHEDASNSTENLDKDIRCKQVGRDVQPSDRKQNRKSLLQSFATGENCNDACTDDEFLMVLPIAVAYLHMNSVKFGVSYLRQLQSIPAIYSKILLDGFRNWNGYTSRNIFQEEYDKSSSTGELVNFFHCSMLGKAICMLQYHFTLNVNSLKKKKMMKLFDSICPCSGLPDDFFGFNVDEIKSCSHQQALNFVNRVIAKISFCRMLLFPKDNLILPLLTEANGHPEEISSKPVSDKVEALTLRFIKILVSALHNIVKIFPLVTENSVRLKTSDSSWVFRYLEVFILRNILELSVKVRDYLIQMSDVTFIEQFARSSFLHRFEDPTTLKVLRCVLITISEGKLSCGVIYELLQAHSKFVSSILWSDSTSSDLLNTGMLLRPMSSVLKSNFFINADQSVDNEIDFATSHSYRQKLEVIKLLRVLYHLKSRQGSIAPAEDTKVNSKELLSLLLSCYGATLSETDLEIFDLMHEIVSAEASESVSIAEMDYLWGSSALKLREKTLENSLLFDNTTDCETVEVRRRQQFRENLALDSKRCGATIVNFPYDRLSSRRPILMKKIEENDLMDILEASSDSIERIQRYDPAFILRFAIHGLSMAYIETMEFAGLGLLAIAFMSISSLDEEIRKLGYETLGRFNNALESCRNRKDVSMLRFLLLYLQNGITEPWQRVPSFTAIFVAEASFILLDPSHDHYHTISKLFKNKIKLKCIPLFDEMFGSISKNFKTDRLWILRLSYAGLNSEDDARIFMRNCIVETCLSFYASSLSDYPSKTLILQIVKKSIKLRVLACYLVQKCNLISWLSSVLSSCGERQCEDDKCMFLTEATIILEVVIGVLSVETINEWLKQHALEQLSELTFQALKLFTSGSKIINQNLALVNLILTVLVSTLRISQERNLNQPHLTFSNDGIFRLYGAVDKGSNNTRAFSSAELVLRAILTSAPPAIVSQMDGEKLKKIIMWGISTASKSYSKGITSKESDCCLKEICGKEVCKESQMSILLRWTTASVILGSISRKSLKKTFFLPERSNLQSLQMLLEHTKNVNREVEGDDREVSEIQCRNNEVLAARILYLQQLLGINCKVLPSVVSALCLLLLSHSARNTGTVSLDEDQIELVASMCSKIRCPAEANPAWQWVYDQPKEEHQSMLAGPGKMQPDNIASELTELQNLEECHACEELLLVFSNALKGKSSKSQLLSHQDLNACGVFTWERNILVNQVPS